MGEVHADLVGPARHRLAAHQRVAVETLGDGHAGGRGLPVRGHPHPAALLEDRPDRLLDDHHLAFVEIGLALDQRQVALGDPALLERAPEHPLRLEVLRHEHDPRGVLVDPVHEARAIGEAAVLGAALRLEGLLLHALQQRARHGTELAMPALRLDREARGLVHCEDVHVLVEDRELDVRGDRPGRRTLPVERRHHDLVRPQPLTRLRLLAVEEHATRRDLLAYEALRETRVLQAQVLVELEPRPFARHDERVHGAHRASDVRASSAPGSGSSSAAP